jgi:ribosomal protein S18 acetylase RimI-like enzyme
MAPRVVSSAADLQVAAHLLVAFNTEYDDPVPDVGWLAEHLGRLASTGGTRVLLTGDPACGVAVVRLRTQTWADELEAYVAELYVTPEHRGHGVGRELMTAVLDDARGQGATYADLGTSQDDVAACRLYESLGFDCHEGRGGGPLALYYELTL